MKNKIKYIFSLVMAVALIFVGCTPAQNNQNNFEEPRYDNQPAEIVEEQNPNDNIGQTENAEKTVETEKTDSLGNIDEEETIDEYGLYTSPEEVALYIHTYNKLPANFITKKEAIALGWESNEGNLWEVTEQMSIGGDVFGNREGKLPKKDGRKWFECDVNYQGGYREAERIVFSNDGLIYYTDDHYETFTKLY